VQFDSSHHCYREALWAVCAGSRTLWGYRELSNCSAAMTATPRPRFDEWLLAQADREDPVGDIAGEFSEDRNVGCAGDIRTPEQLISHIERVHHLSEPGIRAFEQARSEYLRGRVDPLRGRT
jgi:hypothetical protein